MAYHPTARDALLLQATVLDPRDDVATALVDLAAGTRISLGVGDGARDVVTLERIAAGHKFALRPLTAGHPVRKYGEIIGCATQAVAVGAWVHVHNLAPDTEERKVGAVVGAEVDPRSGASVSAGSATKRGFDGYRRRDGRVGVRNHVLVLSPTGLTSAAARRIASLVRGTVCVASGYGRGQVAADAKLHFDTLAGLATHPNVAAVVVVSAGDDITGTYVDAIVAQRASRHSACRCRACTRTRSRWSMPAFALPRGWSTKRRRCAASAATSPTSASRSSAGTPMRRPASSAIRSPAA